MIFAETIYAHHTAPDTSSSLGVGYAIPQVYSKGNTISWLPFGTPNVLGTVFRRAWKYFRQNCIIRSVSLPLNIKFCQRYKTLVVTLALTGICWGKTDIMPFRVPCRSGHVFMCQFCRYEGNSKGLLNAKICHELLYSKCLVSILQTFPQNANVHFHLKVAEQKHIYI